MEVRRRILCAVIYLLYLTLILQSIQWYKVNSIGKYKACSVCLSLKLDAKSYPGIAKEGCCDNKWPKEGPSPQRQDEKYASPHKFKYVCLVLDLTIGRHTDEPRTDKESKRSLLDLF